MTIDATPACSQWPNDTPARGVALAWLLFECLRLRWAKSRASDGAAESYFGRCRSNVSASPFPADQ